MLRTLGGSFQNEYTIKVTGTQYNSNSVTANAGLYPMSKNIPPTNKAKAVKYIKKSGYQLRPYSNMVCLVRPIN